MRFNSYESLKPQKANVLELLTFHFKEIGRRIKKRITDRQVRNPVFTLQNSTGCFS